MNTCIEEICSAIFTQCKRHMNIVNTVFNGCYRGDYFSVLFHTISTKYCKRGWYGIHMSCICLGIRLRNFEIRVGHEEQIGNNAICYNQSESVMPGVTRNFICSSAIFGSWISINKSDTDEDMVHLHIREVRVYNSKYITMPSLGTYLIRQCHLWSSQRIPSKTNVFIICFLWA